MTSTPDSQPEFPTDSLASGEADAVRVVGLGQRWVVIDKPAGLLSVPGRGEDKQDCAASRVQAMFPHATGPLTVHRLDMDTSGLMVFALSPLAHGKLSRQFQLRKTTKRYTAVLEGAVEGETGEVDLPLFVDWPNRPRQQVDYILGKPALTQWRVVARDGGRTRVEMTPITGRSHQLRVHAATPRDEGGIGSPIVGDVLYGNPEGEPRMLLHASHLAFWDPLLGTQVEIESEAPF